MHLSSGTRTRWWIFCLGLAMGIVHAAPVLADQVKVRAWEHLNYGRIVFDWPASVGYQTSGAGEQLTISFQRPITADYSAVPRRLPSYIAGMSDAGGSATLITLKPGVQLRKTTIRGNSIVVDLTATSAAAPQPTASAGSTKAINVRVGRHENHTRVVFDWTQNVTYQVKRDGDQAVVTFNKPDAIAISRLTRAIPPRMTSASFTQTAGGSRVVLGLGADTRIRHFRSGTKVVIDILGGSATAAAAPTATANTAPAKTTAPPKPVDKSKPKSLLPPAAKAAKPADQKPKKVEEKTAKKKPAEEPTSKGPGTKIVFAPLEGGGARLSFAWDSTVAAAVFSRAGHVWAVFDRGGKINMSPIPKSLSEIVFLAERINVRNRLALRFRVDPELKPVARRQGNRWAIEFRSSSTTPPKPVQIERTSTKDKVDAILLAGANANKIIKIVDPEVGDTIHVAPILTPGVGIGKAREFVQFTLLSSAQGVAVVPKADGLSLRTRKNGLEVALSGGLSVSQVGKQAKSILNKSKDSASSGEDENDDLGPPARIFNYAGWAGNAKIPFEDRKQKLQTALGKVTKGRRNRARWPLARFFFANHYAADASGVLTSILSNDPAIIEDPNFRALRGATNLWLGRVADAEADLLVPGLDGDPEMAVWRGAMFALKHEWKRSYDEFVSAGGVPQKYSQRSRVWLEMRATEAALKANDLEMANKYLIALNKEENLRPLQSTEIQLLRGYGFEAVGDLDAAVENYLEVMDAGIRPTEARAKFARINAGLKNRELTLQDATEELEQLRFSWRGDSFEFELLRRLGDLYLDNGEYRNALSVYRLAVTYFPKLPDGKVVAQEMNDIFKRLFLDGEADALSAISALALYYDFRELTPVGKPGDEMIRQLASRLVSVDLLTQAAQLLEHQVKFRLKSVEKARVGLRLAVIYMLNRQFEKALSTLKITRWRNLPGDLLTERRQVEARILANLDKPEDALLAMVGDESQEAKLIRVDLYWQMRRWQDTVSMLGDLLGDAWEGPRALLREERAYVLRTAVAMALDGNEEGLDVLRERYVEKMRDTADFEGFDLITQKIDPRTTEFRKVSGAIAQIDTLESFMTRYREKLYGDEVGAVN